MKDLLLTLLHLAVMPATLCGPGGVRAVIAENLLLKQQLIVLRRPRQRAPRLTASDRLLFGFGSLFLSPGRVAAAPSWIRTHGHNLELVEAHVIAGEPVVELQKMERQVHAVGAEDEALQG